MENQNANWNGSLANIVVHRGWGLEFPRIMDQLSGSCVTSMIHQPQPHLFGIRTPSMNRS